MSIVITGATGGLGSLVVQYLLKKVPANDIVVSVRHPEKAAALAEHGIEVRHGDYDDPASLEKAFAGASKLLLISSPSFNDIERVRQHATAIEVAKKVGVGQIVYTGFAYAEQSTLGLAQVHLATEHALRTTGIPYTVLRNAFYAHIFVNPDLKKAVERGELVTSTRSGKLNAVPRSDLALAVATVLAEEGHENKVYELTAPQPWSIGELAQTLSEVSGKRVIHHAVSEPEMEDELKKAGVPEHFIPFQLIIYRAIANGEFASTSEDLQRLIGNGLTPLQESVRQVL